MTEKRPTFARPPWWRARKAELLEALEDRGYLFVVDEETLNELAFSYLSLSNAPLALHRVSVNTTPEVLRKLHDQGYGFLIRSYAEGERLSASLPRLSPDEVSLQSGYRTAKPASGAFSGKNFFGESGEWSQASTFCLEGGDASKWLKQLQNSVKTNTQTHEWLLELNLPIPTGNAEREHLIVALEDMLFDFREEFPELRLALVPNALLVAEAGILLCRVKETDTVNGRPAAILDAPLGSFLAPEFLSGHAVMRLSGQDEDSENSAPVTLYGSKDSRRLYPMEVRLPPLATGDVLAVFHAGAFGDRPFTAARREAVFFLKARAVCTLC